MSKKFPKHLDIQKFIDERVPKPVPVKPGRGLVHGAPLMLSAGAALRFVGPIQSHTLQMIKIVTEEVTKLFNSEHAQAHIARMNDETTGQDASVGSQARILTNAFKAQFDKLFASLAATLAADMVANVSANSKQQLNASINNQQQNGSPLQQKAATITLDPRLLDPATVEVLKASTKYAADFIKSIPDMYLGKVSDAVMASIQTGNGLQDLIPYLEKQGNTTLNWAGNTAMDQTRKTFSALNRTRMQAIGIKRATWIHSGGSQHPRERHEDYDGQTYLLSEGAPVGDYDGNNVQTGEEPNCRCTNKPVLNDLFADSPD